MVRWRRQFVHHPGVDGLDHVGIPLWSKTWYIVSCAFHHGFGGRYSILGNTVQPTYQITWVTISFEWDWEGSVMVKNALERFWKVQWENLNTSTWDSRTKPHHVQHRTTHLLRNRSWSSAGPQEKWSRTWNCPSWAIFDQIHQSIMSGEPSVLMMKIIHPDWAQVGPEDTSKSHNQVAQTPWALPPFHWSLALSSHVWPHWDP